MTSPLVPREFAFDVAADLDTVWRALTTAEGLAAWYVVAADIDLREGGELRLDWGVGDAPMGTFDAVDPPHRLRLVYEHQDGQPTGAEEWLLSHDTGVTHVRLIHSLPVAAGATWDDTYPGIVRGWALFLGTLEWLLEAGHEPRRTATPVVAPLAPGAWSRVLAVLGLAGTPPGGHIVASSAGDGEVLVSADGYSLLMEFDGKGTLLVDVEGDTLYTVAATYGDDPSVPDLQRRLVDLAGALCAAAGNSENAVDPAGARTSS